MGRKKKIKPEEVVETTPETKLNDAVFTEYPSVEEYVVKPETKPETKPEEVVLANTAVALEPIEDMALKIKGEIDKLDSDLKVVYTKQFGKMIRILGNNGMHCFSRVRELGDKTFLGEFLSFIPVHHLKSITAIYSKLGVINKNGTYLSTSGLV